MDISIILQSFQIGRFVGNLFQETAHIEHLDEMLKGFEHLRKAEIDEDIRIAYHYFKAANPNDKKIVLACSLYGRAFCLPFFREYEKAISCVEELKQMKYTKRSGLLGGTSYYKTIEELQVDSDNLLNLIEEVRKRIEVEPKQETESESIPNIEIFWKNIIIGILIILLISVLVCFFVTVH